MASKALRFAVFISSFATSFSLYAGNPTQVEKYLDQAARSLTRKSLQQLRNDAADVDGSKDFSTRTHAIEVLVKLPKQAVKESEGKIDEAEATAEILPELILL